MTNNRSLHQAHVDGSSLGNPGPAGWAVYLDGKTYTGAINYATNNFAEMIAVEQVLELVPANSDVTITTDSRLVIGWFTRGWKLNNPKIRAIKRRCDTLRDSKALKVSFVKTKGHASDKLNNKVDMLARGVARTVIPVD